MTILSRDASPNVLASLWAGSILLSVEASLKPHFRTILPNRTPKVSTDRPARSPLTPRFPAKDRFDSLRRDGSAKVRLGTLRQPTSVSSS